jgi:outer membrane protein assembly factor BamB
MKNRSRRNFMCAGTAAIALAALAIISPLVAVGVEGAVVPGSDDWPQWLGPNRNGEAPAAGILKSWGKEGPVEVWRRPIGEGFSGFAVVGDLAYTMYMEGADEYLACLNAGDGSERWRLRTGPGYVERQGGSGPRGTPSVDGGGGNAVYAIGANGDLVAAEAKTGKLLWKRQLMGDFGAKRPRWGFSGSPLVIDDVLFVEAGGSEGRALMALAKSTGEVLWASQNDNMGYSSPVAITAAGARQILFFTAAGLVSLAPDNGALNFRYNWPTSYDVNAATPLFIPPDRVFVSSGYGNGGAVVRIERSGETLSVTELWKNAGMKNQMATSVLHENHIYGIDDSILTCLDATSGEERWKARGYGKGTLILAGGTLIVLGDKGKLGFVEADPTAFVELASAQVLEGLCWTAPSLAGGRLYLRNESEAVCLQVAAR